MAEGIVLDTSVLVKWFIKEPGHEASRRIRSQHLSGELEIHISELALVELANALSGLGGLTETDITNSVRATMALNLEVHSISDVLLRAVEMAWEKSITVYDATHLALADKLKVKLSTFDKEILRKAAHIAEKP